MAESVDALVSNTSGAIRAGSIPAPGTRKWPTGICRPFLYKIFPTFSPHLPIILQKVFRKLSIFSIFCVMISRWKKEFIENSAAAFETPKIDDAAIEKEKDRYLRKIGDLEMQLDFAKRVSKKLGIEIPAED